MSKPLPTARECGKCQACCFAIAVFNKSETLPLNKPAFQRCEHLTKRGCGVYEDRPGACRVYGCLWLDGMFSARDRPDRLGVVFEFTPEGAPKAVVGTEIRPGAVDSKRVRKVIEQVKRVVPGVMLIRFGGGHGDFHGDASLLDEISKAANETAGTHPRRLAGHG